MSRFFPDSSTVIEIRSQLQADPRYQWEAAFRATATERPHPDDRDRVVEEFMALVSELSLSTGDLDFWAVVVQFTEDDATRYHLLAIDPVSGALVHAGMHPRAGEALSADDRVANPALAQSLVHELNSRLVHCGVLTD